MHRFVNIFVLNINSNVELFARLFQKLPDSLHVFRRLRNINHHNHGKIIPHDSLADIKDVDIILCHNRAYAGNNSDFIFAYNGNNSIHQILVLR